MRITVEPSPALYIALQKELEAMGKGDRTKEVLRKAIRETAKETKERIHSETKVTYTIKTASFKKTDIKVTNPSKGNTGALIEIKGSPLGIRKSYQNRRNGKRKGASAMVKTEGSMKELTITSGNKQYKAFVTTMKTGHEGIFQRVPGEQMKKRPGREKIREIMSMSRAKAAEIVYRDKIEADVKGELSYRLHKHMNAVIYGRK